MDNSLLSSTIFWYTHNVSDLITTKEAAAILGVSQVWIQRLIRAGALPAQRLGRDWLIARSDLIELKRRPPGRPRKSPNT